MSLMRRLVARVAIVEIETTRNNVLYRLLSLNRISPFLVCSPFPPLLFYILLCATLYIFAVYVA